MYSNAKFDGDSDFSIKHDLNPRFDGDMNAQRQKTGQKRDSEEKGLRFTQKCTLRNTRRCTFLGLIVCKYQFLRARADRPRKRIRRISTIIIRVTQPLSLKNKGRLS